MSNVTINKERELYVIPCGNGYTCLGFDVCLDRARKLAVWLTIQGIECEAPTDRGELATYDAYKALLRTGQEYCERHRTRCPIELTPQLEGLEGRRVEVVDCYDETRRFQVGRSMGWMPCHLELARRDSTGGGGVTGAPFKSVRVLR